ncbi:metallophosphoesterase [Methanolobus sp. ZRKC2]|uniref:metallophosphoesterase n=1 Tax=Methanolobus sp. ZRKC2 TaxID=3125783 RepID=UPI00324A826B
MIGIMSDSHDNLEAIKDAVKFFNEKKVTTVLHAGDIISPFTSRAFKELDARLYFVFGNNDGDRNLLRKKFNNIGAECCEDFADLNIEGKHIALLHGIYESQVNAIAESGHFDIVVRGHTHVAGSKEINKTLIVNPGETAGVLTGKKTVALLGPEIGVQINEI